jgi:hypothetical protein
VLGTPVYISPEQCRNAAAIDGRADLYSLGCVMYELVCGHPPFTVDSVGDLIAHHLYFEPPPPRSCGAEISEPVEQLILWLLRKQPDARPGNARELIDAIDRLASDVADGVPGALPTSASAAHGAPRAMSEGITTGPVPFVPTPAPSRVTSTTLSAASGILSVSPEARRRGLRIAGVAAITVLAGIAVYVALDGGGRAPAPGPGQTVAVAPAAEPPPGSRSAEPPPAPRPSSGALEQGAPPAAAPALPPPTAGEPGAAAPRSVHLALDTRPRGATVLVDGRAVGTTPFSEDIPAGSASRVYTLNKPGYEPVTATLDTAGDAARRIELRKLPAAARPAAGADLGDKGVNPFDH